MRFLFTILTVLFIIASCDKARRCQCVDSSQAAAASGDDTSIIYINGNKKYSKKACTNLADSTEVCTLKDN